MSKKHEWKKGIALDESTQIVLRSFVKDRGERAAAIDLNVSVTSIVRAAAGLGLRNGTILLIRMGLEKLEEKAA